MGEYTVDWNGLSGGVFWMVLISVVFYLVGMSTVSWGVDDEKEFHVGLWDASQCNVDILSPCKYIFPSDKVQKRKPYDFFVVNRQQISTKI